MESFKQIATISELTDGTMKMFNVGGREILLAKAGDKYFAADNRCPHMGGNLSQGVLQGTVLTCPRHHSQFDLTDGHVVRWTDWTGLQLNITKIIRAPRPLKTYGVKIDGDKIMISNGRVPAIVA